MELSTNKESKNLKVTIKIFDFSNRKFSRKTVDCFLAVLVLMFFLASLNRPYVELDPLIYSQIGRAIYKQALLPFAYVFDHKPIFTYYIYGLLSVAVPDIFPKYQAVSLIMYVVTAWVISKASGKEPVLHCALMLAAFSILFMRFSGNTEVFVVPFAIGSLVVVVLSGAARNLMFAGFLAAIALNINYLAAILIGPGFFAGLFFQNRFSIKAIKPAALCGLGFVAGLAVIFFPYVFSPPGTLQNYFALQSIFVAGYRNHAEPGKSIIGYVCSVAPLVLVVLASWKCEEKNVIMRNVMAIAFVSAIFASSSSGKFYFHYSYLMLAPMLVLWSISTGRWRHHAATLALLVLTIPAVFTYYRDFGRISAIPEAYRQSEIKDLHARVGQEPIMTIHTPQNPIYLGHLVPMHPFLWPDHARVIFGDEEDDFYAGIFAKNPKFVLAPRTLCDDSSADQSLNLTKTCVILPTRYKIEKSYTGASLGGINLYRKID